jgi:hypothetical protein
LIGMQRRRPGSHEAVDLIDSEEALLSSHALRHRVHP